MKRLSALFVLFAALAPAVHAAAPAESDLGAAVKWDILTTVRYIRSQVPDACLSRAGVSLTPEEDVFLGHFWSAEKRAFYVVRVRGHSEIPDDLQKGDTAASPVCIRDVPIGADKALAVAFKHGLTRGVGMRLDLELLKIDADSMGDDTTIWSHLHAARGHVVWVVSSSGMDLHNAWVIDAVSGKFLKHADIWTLDE
jgi:hypothetical protein